MADTKISLLTSAFALVGSEQIPAVQGGSNVKLTPTQIQTFLNLAASATIDTTNASNISSGTLGAARLPNPSATTLGGIESYAAVAHQWINSISTSGIPSSTQPASTDLSDGTTAGRSMFTAASAAAQTALLSAVVGDSGSGGTKGLVPAPAAGDAAAGKFLKADGTFAVPAGGGGTPGGANTQVQFDNSGSFGGSANLTWVSPTLTIGVQQTTQGALTLANTAAGAFATTLAASNSAAAAWTLTLPVTAGTSGQFLKTDGAGTTSWASPSGSGTVNAGAAGQIAYYASTGSVISGSSELTFESANVLALQAGTSAQSLRVYNTWSSAGANYERGVFDFSTNSNVLTIGTQAAGTGSGRNIALVGGNVGVNATGPSHQLEVAGTFAVTGSNDAHFGKDVYLDANNQTLRGTKTAGAGGGSVGLISLNSSNQVSIDSDGQGTVFGGVVSFSNLTIGSGGSAAGAGTGLYLSGANLSFAVGGSQAAYLASGGAFHSTTDMYIPNNKTLRGTQSGGGTNACIGINSSNVVSIDGDGIGSVFGGTVQLTPVAYASLPVSPVAGMIAYINNCNTTTWGATAAGGGSSNVLVWYNGTAWTVFSK